MRRHSPYNYTFNNPVRFIDPDGMGPDDPNFWQTLFAALGLGFENQPKNKEEAEEQARNRNAFNAANAKAKDAEDKISKVPLARGLFKMAKGGMGSFATNKNYVTVVGGIAETVTDVLAFAESTWSAEGVQLLSSALTVDNIFDLGSRNLQTKKSGKEKGNDFPDWAKGNKPLPGESGPAFAKRVMDTQYGKGNWNQSKKDTGPGSEYNKLKKYGERSK